MIRHLHNVNIPILVSGMMAGVIMYRTKCVNVGTMLFVTHRGGQCSLQFLARATPLCGYV